MRGESLAAAVLRWQRIDGDRQYAFLREANRSRFPRLTARELSAPVRYTPRYLDPARPPYLRLARRRTRRNGMRRRRRDAGGAARN